MSNQCSDETNNKRREFFKLTKTHANIVRRILMRDSLLNAQATVRTKARPFNNGFRRVLFELCRKPGGCSKKERISAARERNLEDQLSKYEQVIRRQMNAGWQWHVAEDERYHGQMRIYDLERVPEIKTGKRKMKVIR